VESIFYLVSQQSERYPQGELQKTNSCDFISYGNENSS
jgi:hypothetical protein